MPKYRLKIVSVNNDVFLSRTFEVKDEEAKVMFIDMIEKALPKGISFMADDGTVFFFMPKALGEAKEISVIEEKEEEKKQ